MRHLCVLTLALVALFGSDSVFPAAAAPNATTSMLLAFVHHDNVWIAQADGTEARALTHDGTGARIVQGRQITYAYLTWSPGQQRLLVARFASSNQPGVPYRQGWSLETWTPGAKKLTPFVTNINSEDFVPQWSADGHKIAYMDASSYDDHTTLFRNTIGITDLSGRVTTLARFTAREGCLDGSMDPSELTFWGLVGPGGIRQTFIWSGTGRFLVYATECIHTGLVYHSLATGHQHMIGRSMTEAVLSPDGKRLAGVDQQHLVLSNPDGTARRIFKSTLGARLPVWSPDGHFVYYLARRTLRTLRYHDRAGHLFEFQLDRASIERLDVTSGQVRTLLTRPVHAFANLAPSADGRWLYFTQVTNSDELYRHLIHAPAVTNRLLTRYGPRTDVLRIPAVGGPVQTVIQDSGQVTVSGSQRS